MKEIFESRKASRGQSGFTLIELLVVIAIMAVLAGVAVFAVNGLTADAGINACKVEGDTLVTAANAAEATTPTTDVTADFLAGDADSLKYFTIGGARKLLDEVSETDCAAVTSLMPLP